MAGYEYENAKPAEVVAQIRKLKHEFEIIYSTVVGKSQYGGTKSYEVQYRLDGQMHYYRTAAENSASAKAGAARQALNMIQKQDKAKANDAYFERGSMNGILPVSVDDISNNRDYKTADRRAREQLAKHFELMKKYVAQGMTKEQASEAAYKELTAKKGKDAVLPVSVTDAFDIMAEVKRWCRLNGVQWTAEVEKQAKEVYARTGKYQPVIEALSQRKAIDAFKFNKTATLTQYPADHQFYPGEWKLTKLNNGKFESSTVHPTREHAEKSAAKSKHVIAKDVYTGKWSGGCTRCGQNHDPGIPCRNRQKWQKTKEVPEKVIVNGKLVGVNMKYVPVEDVGFGSAAVACSKCGSKNTVATPDGIRCERCGHREVKDVLPVPVGDAGEVPPQRRAALPGPSYFPEKGGPRYEVKLASGEIKRVCSSARECVAAAKEIASYHGAAHTVQALEIQPKTYKSKVLTSVRGAIGAKDVLPV